MLEWLEQAMNGQNTLPLSQLLPRLAAAFGLGCLAAGIHYLTCGRGKRRIDRSFLATLVLLSLLIALVTVVIGNNVARAFSLVGTLAIVRFRTVVQDTRDTAFVIYAVASGMCAGTDYAVGPLACAPLVLLAAWVFRPLRREPTHAEGKLVLRLPAGQPPSERVETLLKQYLPAHRLKGVSTARGGSALDATYAVHLPGPEQVFALINELARMEGVQGVELKEI